MAIGLLCDYVETDEMGIKLTAKELGIDIVYIPFRKVSIGIGEDGSYNFKSKGNDYSRILKEVEVVLNRAQSKNRRLIAASFLETVDKHAINPLRIEFLCFSKFRVLLCLLKGGIKVPKTVFIPCDSHEFTKDGHEIRNEEHIADLVQLEISDEMLVVKPDAGTHGKEVRLVKGREELIGVLKKIKPSIINPVGVLAQKFVQKWFYDLRIIVFKEKGKTPCCHPKAMARAGIRDFRTNTALGNFVFDVDLPTYIREMAVKCGSAIGGDCEAWLLALDAMIDFGEEKFADDKYIRSALERLAKPFEAFKRVKEDPLKKSNFPNWNKKLEEAFQRYTSLEAYESVRKIINESVEKNRYKVLFHEANSCPEFWEQTRLATGANLADFLFKCAKSITN